MNWRNTVEKYLENEPQARERKNRSRAIWNLLAKYHGFETIDKEKWCAIYTDADTINRYIRMIQMEREDLRGQDYDTKQIVEERAELALGYEPRYHQDIKKLETL